MIIDSNIIIYSLKPEHNRIRKFISDNRPSVSVITVIEVLGYHLLSDRDKEYFSVLFSFLNVIQLDETIATKAIALKQIRKITLGDSIIAASALCYGLSLVTHNTQDFEWIPDLGVVDILNG